MIYYNHTTIHRSRTYHLEQQTVPENMGLESFPVEETLSQTLTLDGMRNIGDGGTYGEEEKEPETQDMTNKERSLSQGDDGVEEVCCLALSPLHKLDLPGKLEPQSGTCLHQIGLWTCLWGVFLIDD